MENNHKPDLAMNNEATCSRVLLSKNEIGRIVFCEGCSVAELEIGAISLRIEGSALNTLKMLVADAATRLTLYQQEQAVYAKQTAVNYNVH